MSENNLFPGTTKRLKQIRSHLKLSKEDMAKYLGVTLGGYYKNENGVTSPSLPVLKKLAKQDDISLDWFLLDKGPMFFEKERNRVKELEQTLEFQKEKLNELETLKTEIETLKTNLEEMNALEERNRELEATLEERNGELERIQHEREREREALSAEKEQERVAFLKEQKQEREAFLRELGEKENRLREQLTKELREQLVTELEEDLKKERAAAGGIETRSEIRELLDHMTRVPLLYHEVLVHLHRFKIEHRDMVDAAMSVEA
jgi:transcriptional regulator with XRE-family HTH domain